MKRYTGQQALYEAISRSRAKAKQGSILERLRPESEKRKAQESGPSAEPMQGVEQTPGLVVQEPNDPPAVETPSQLQDGQELPVQPVAEASSEPLPETPAEPVERAGPVVIPRPIERMAYGASPKPVQTWLRPRPVQLNEGRLEISVPYYIGVIAALVVMVVVLAAFRLGQARSGEPVSDAGQTVQPVANRAAVPANPPTPTVPQESGAANPSRPPATAPTRQDAAAAQMQGDHLIVLAPCTRQEDFEPVKRHFAANDIELEIVSLDLLRKVLAEGGLNTRAVPSGGGFLIVVKQYFENPESAGTDGFAMKQNVVRVGALYKGKAPPGCESFGPHYFDDAYGIKIRKTR